MASYFSFSILSSLLVGHFSHLVSGIQPQGSNQHHPNTPISSLIIDPAAFRIFSELLKVISWVSYLTPCILQTLRLFYQCHLALCTNTLHMTLYEMKGQCLPLIFSKITPILASTLSNPSILPLELYMSHHWTSNGIYQLVVKPIPRPCAIAPNSNRIK